MPIPAALPTALSAQTDKLIRQAAPEKDKAKIEKSAKDFESLLLSNWLQQAEESFAKLPGGDNEDDADSGREQFQGIAMQSLGTTLTNAGGIGIARMISRNLNQTAAADVEQGKSVI